MSEFGLSLIGFNCDPPDSLSVSSGTLKMLTNENDSSEEMIDTLLKALKKQNEKVSEAQILSGLYREYIYFVGNVD